jgi:uncharacterized protein YlzI (FlbEa/FlbD family)
MFIKLLGINNKCVAINSDHIITINEDPLHEGGIMINLINGTSIVIPHTSIEEVTAKINQDRNVSDLGKMTDSICQRIQHLEDAMAAGMQYIGKSVH